VGWHHCPVCSGLGLRQQSAARRASFKTLGRKLVQKSVAPLRFSGRISAIKSPIRLSTCINRKASMHFCAVDSRVSVWFRFRIIRRIHEQCGQEISDWISFDASAEEIEITAGACAFALNQGPEDSGGGQVVIVFHFQAWQSL